jgi:hypothetical protein
MLADPARSPNEDGLYEIVGHEEQLSAQQRAAIDALDKLISSKIGEQHAAFWNETAVREHPVWEEIRIAAKDAADTFGWILHSAPLSDAVYVRAHPNGS